MAIKIPGIHAKFLKIPDDPIKKPSTRIRYNDKMKEELRKCKADPAYFLSTYYHIQHPVKGNLIFKPFPYQIKAIEYFQKHNKLIAMWGRQMGKTTVVGGLLLWLTMFHKDKVVLLVANNAAQALEIMGRIQYGYENCPDFIRASVANGGYAKGHIDFTNGSRVVSRATSPHAGRGLSISLLYVDEFAAIQPNMQADFWAAVSQTLATGGGCFITSTPYTEFDTFASIWRGANRYTDKDGQPMDPEGAGFNGFKAIKATWAEHPDRDEEWEADQRATIGDDQRFEREQNCEFVGYSETLIDGMILKTIMEKTDVVKPFAVTGQVQWYKKPEKNKTYLVGHDPSLGTGGDYAAIEVFELPGMVQVAEWQSRDHPVTEQVHVLRNICGMIEQELQSQGDKDPEIFWSVENNTLGEAALVVIAEIGEENIPGTMLSEPRGSRTGKIRKGFNTTNKTKIKACSKFKTLVEKQKMEINSKELARQLNFFVAAGNSFKAKLGEHDDLVMATVLVIRLLERIMRFDEEMTSDLRESIGETEGREPFPFFAT